jgi:hypothetical protein
VPITLATQALDGGPRAAAGTLTVFKLAQPEKVPRGSLFMPGADGPRPVMPRRGGKGRPAPKIPAPAPADPADVETWAAGEAVLTEKVSTDAATGKTVVTAKLSPGIYRAEFEMPAAGDAPAVKARHTIEVLSPAAERYGVKRPFALVAERLTAQPGSEFKALVKGTQRYIQKSPYPGSGIRPGQLLFNGSSFALRDIVDAAYFVAAYKGVSASMGLMPALAALYRSVAYRLLSQRRDSAFPSEEHWSAPAL